MHALVDVVHDDGASPAVSLLQEYLQAALLFQELQQLRHDPVQVFGTVSQVGVVGKQSDLSSVFIHQTAWNLGQCKAVSWTIMRILVTSFTSFVHERVSRLTHCCRP